MFRKFYPSGSLDLVLITVITFAISFVISYGVAQRRNSAAEESSAAIASAGSDKEQDGLSGPVNRVRTEIAKLYTKSGKMVEGTRELLETTTYDSAGKRNDNSYYLVSSNSQVGREEYRYDDKGNIGEMTLRDGNNNILSREVYSYEYDTIGNWNKMITSTVVYEGGKVTLQPSEVTYRSISYYFDQAIAAIVKPDSQAGRASDAQRAQGELAALRNAFKGWVAATNARDLETLLGFYNSRMEAFYRVRDASQEVVRADRTRLFERAQAVEVTTSDPEITISSDDRTATMRFYKQYLIKVKGRERRGEVIQQLQWLRTAEGWRITSERDLKVLRSR